MDTTCSAQAAVARAGVEIDKLYSLLLYRAVESASADATEAVGKKTVGAVSKVPLKLKSTSAEDAVPVDALFTLLPCCDGPLSADVKTFIRTTRLRYRKLSKTVFRRLVFETFYQPVISEATAAAMSRPDRVLVPISLSCCPFSLAVGAYARGNQLHKSVSKILEQQASEFPPPPSAATPRATVKLHVRRAKAALLNWSKSRLCWKKLQGAIRAGAFSVRRRRANAPAAAVFVWKHAGPDAKVVHVHTPEDVVIDTRVSGGLLLLRGTSGRLYGCCLDGCGVAHSVSDTLRGRLCAVAGCVSGRCYPVAPDGCFAHADVGVNGVVGVCRGEDLARARLKSAEEMGGGCVYAWALPPANTLHGDPSITRASSRGFFSAEDLLTPFPLDTYADRDWYLKAASAFSTEITKLNAELTHLRPTDKLQSVTRAAVESAKIAEHVNTRLREIWRQFHFTAGPRLMLPTPTDGVKQVCASDGHLWLVTSAGTVLVSGCEPGMSPKSVPLSHLEPTMKCVISKISCGAAHTLALSVQGFVLSWGNGAYGQLGHGSNESEPRPRLVESLRSTKLATTDVACARHTSIVCDITGGVWAWGDNTNGQLGVGRFRTSAVVTASEFAHPSGGPVKPPPARKPRVSKPWLRRSGWDATVKTSLDGLVAASVLRGDVHVEYDAADDTLADLRMEMGLSEGFKPILTSVLTDPLADPLMSPSSPAGYGRKFRKDTEAASRSHAAYTAYCVNRNLLYPVDGVDEPDESTVPAQSGARPSDCLLRVNEPVVVADLRRSKVVAVRANGDACGALTVGGSVFVWGRTVCTAGPPVVWSPQPLPLLRQALVHLSNAGCPFAFKQLCDTYGKLPGMVSRPTRPGSPIRVPSRTSLDTCCTALLDRNSLMASSLRNYSVATLSVSDAAVVITLQLTATATDSSRPPSPKR